MDALMFQYAVKFVCGIADDNSRIALSKYWTNVNIHNPNSVPVQISKTVAQGAFESFDQIPPSSETLDTIQPNWAMMVESADIKLIGGISDPDVFVEGFLIIKSSHELDVAVVYTSQVASGSQPTISVQNDIVGRLINELV